MAARICAPHLSDSMFRSVPLAHGVTSGVLLLLLSSLTIPFLCCYGKILRKPVHRIFLYLILSVVVYLAVLTAHVEHYVNYLNQEMELCKALGFLTQYTGTVHILASLGTAVYLMFTSLEQLTLTYLPGQWKKIVEVVYVVALACLPLLVVWIPFVAVEYGEAGPWCWIQRTRNCTLTLDAYFQEIFIWYIPFALVALGSILCVMLVLLIYRKCQHRMADFNVKRTLLIFSFLIVRGVLFAVQIAGHSYTYHSSNTDYDYHLLLFHAIFTPISSAMIPLVFLLYVHTARHCSGSMSVAETSADPESTSAEIKPLLRNS